MSLARIRITTLYRSPHAGAQKLLAPPLALALALSVLALGAGCGSKTRDIKRANNSGYDTDFARVYSVALNVIRKDYPHLEENATTGVIRTSWHPVRLTSEQANMQSDIPFALRNQAGVNPNNPQAVNQLNNPMTQAQLNRRRNRKIYFIRFRVSVVGGDPWRVSVVGEASEWVDGGVPSPLYGANVPPWLPGRVNGVRRRIYKKLKKYAVPLPSTALADAPAPEPVDTEVDQSNLGDLPAKAIEAVVTALGAAKERDYETLEKVMSPEFTWSLGADPSASQALMMWKADSSILEQLSAVLEAGCAVVQKDAEAVCPRAAAQGSYQGHRARFVKGADGVWRMTSFVSGD